jgi:hypothetical protein
MVLNSVNDYPDAFIDYEPQTPENIVNEHLWEQFRKSVDAYELSAIQAVGLPEPSLGNFSAVLESFSNELSKSIQLGHLSLQECIDYLRTAPRLARWLRIDSYHHYPYIDEILSILSRNQQYENNESSATHA